MASPVGRIGVDRRARASNVDLLQVGRMSQLLMNKVRVKGRASYVEPASIDVREPAMENYGEGEPAM